MLAKTIASNNRIIAVGFHVDYFNNPWKDKFSDRKYTARQHAYNNVYKKPKNPEYGLVYTPMMMFDGIEATSGVSANSKSVQALAQRALARKVEATLDLKPQPSLDRMSLGLEMKTTPLTDRLKERKLLIGAVVRESSTVTEVKSGENEGQTLTEYCVARQFVFENLAYKGKKEIVSNLRLAIQPEWESRKLSVVAFVQDYDSGEIYQVDSFPWNASPPTNQPVSKSRSRR